MIFALLAGVCGFLLGLIVGVVGMWCLAAHLEANREANRASRIETSSEEFQLWSAAVCAKAKAAKELPS